MISLLETSAGASKSGDTSGMASSTIHSDESSRVTFEVLIGDSSTNSSCLQRVVSAVVGSAALGLDKD